MRNQRDFRKAVTIRGLSVEVRFGNVDGAMRKLRKQVDDDGRLKEYAERMYFEKPSEVKRKKHKKAVSRYKKKLQKEREDLDNRSVT